MGQSKRYGRVEEGGESDRELVSRARVGDIEALARLIERHQDRLFNAMYRVVGHYEDAEELTQEAFVRALRGLGRFRGSSGFYTWLFRIGMNLAINFRRRSRPVHFSALEASSGSPGRQAAGLMDLLESPGAGPAGEAALREQHRRVLSALGELEPASRAVVVLRDIEGLGYGEIASILELPLGTVKSRLSRARGAIRERLGEDGF